MPHDSPGRQPQDVAARFAEVMKDRRERLGLSQTRLAEILEMDRSAISRIESGDRDPRFSEAVAIAGALSMELFSFVNPSAQTYSAHLQLIQTATIEARRQTLIALTTVDKLQNSMTEEAEAEVARIAGFDSYSEAFFAQVKGLADDLQSDRGKSLLEMDPHRVYLDRWDKSIKEEIVRGVTGNILMSEDEFFTE